MTFVPFFVMWLVLAGGVLFLALYRKLVALGEDDTLHVLDAEAGMVHKQIDVAQKLDAVDRWGKLLTIVVVVSGVVLTVAYLYSVWQASGGVS